MQRYILKLAVFGFLTAVLAGSALAHHGWTGYDETKTITLTGVIREASYENPHARDPNRTIADEMRAERIIMDGKATELR